MTGARRSQFLTECLVTGKDLGTSGCPFNPTIFQIGSEVPGLPPWGLLGLCSGLLLTGVILAVRRRWMVTTRTV